MHLGRKNSTEGRRTRYREEREEFIEAFQSRFPGDTRDVDRSFDELFDIVPADLARHNQGDFSNDLGNSTTSSSETTSNQNTPNAHSSMEDQQPAAAAPVKQMPSYWHHTALKFSEDQPRELKRFFEELSSLFGPANVTTDGEKKGQTVC